MSAKEGWAPATRDPEQVRLAELNELMIERGRQVARSCLRDFGLDEALAGYVEGLWEGSSLPEVGSDAESRFVYAFQCGMAAGLHDALQAYRRERGEDDGATEGEAAAPAPAEGT